jgi:hypothetical protein
MVSSLAIGCEIYCYFTCCDIWICFGYVYVLCVSAVEAQDPDRLFLVDSEDPIPAIPAHRWLLPLRTHLDALECLLDRLPTLIPTLQSDPIHLGMHPTPTEIRDAILATNNPHTQTHTQYQQQAANSFPRHVPTPFGCTLAVVECITNAMAAVHSAHSYGHMETQVNTSHAINAGAFLFLLSASHTTCGVGKLGNREGVGLYGTENEITLYGSIDTMCAALKPADSHERTALQAYKQIGEACIHTNTAVFCVFFNNPHGGSGADTSTAIEGFVDVAPMAELCDLSGGYVHMFTGNMLLEENAIRLTNEIQTQIDSIVGNDVVMKLRLGDGLAVESCICGGGKFLPVEEEIELACVHTDTSMCFTLKLTQDLREDEPVFAQLACLYTNVLTQVRSIRVHNYCFYPTKSDPTLFRYIDVDALVAYYAKTCVHKALSQPLTRKDDKNYVSPYTSALESFVEMLAKYRLRCVPNSGKSKLVIPDSVRYAPWYMCGLSKHTALAPNALSEASFLDFRQVSHRASKRAFMIRYLQRMPVRECLLSLCPQLYAIHQVFDTAEYDTFLQTETSTLTDSDTDRVKPKVNDTDDGVATLLQLPRLSTLSSEFLQSDGVYLLNDGLTLYLFMGRNIATADIQEWFGSQFDRATAPQVLQDLRPRPGSVIGQKIVNFVELVRRVSLHKQGTFNLLSLLFLCVNGFTYMNRVGDCVGGERRHQFLCLL